MDSIMNTQAVSGPLLAWLIQAVVYGSALAMLTWALVIGPLRRCRPAVHGALWLIVLVKFIVPVGPAAPFSLATLMKSAAWSVAPGVAGAGSGAAARGADVLMIPLDGADAPPPAAASAERAARRGPTWAALTALAYVACVVCVGLWRIARFRRFAAAARGLPLAGYAVRRMVARACATLGVRRVPVVRLSEQASAPYVFGVRRPTLVLSRRQLVDRCELEAVVYHEIAHLRRGDMLVRHLQWLAGTALFFWPVVAWVNRRIDLAREHVCDEWALRHGRLSAGDYARCLLRAVQPVRSGAFTYQPTAMAANVSHIERRIDMIMDHPVRSAMRRGFGMSGAVVTAGWACFALAGAGAAIRLASQDARPAQETPRQIVVEVNQGDADEADVLVLDGAFDGDAPFPGFPVAPPDGAAMMMWVTQDELPGGDGAQQFMHVVMAPSPRMLAGFATEHPTADADQDGKVTKVEYDAYLVALAQTDVPAVLAKYPKSDRDSDARLSPMETARLVQGGEMIERLREQRSGGMRVIRLGGEECDKAGVATASGTWVSERGDAAGQRRIRVVKRHSAGTQVDEDVIIAGAASDASDGAKTVELSLAGPACDLGQPVGKWLLENLTATPSAADVARYVPVVEEAPLVTFLELNPKADVNGDGKLTPEERDAYIEGQSTRARERFLKQHPESDTDGDGLLTKQEMHEWLKANAPAMGAAPGQRVFMKKIVGTDGQADVTVEFKPATEPK